MLSWTSSSSAISDPLQSPPTSRNTYSVSAFFINDSYREQLQKFLVVCCAQSINKQLQEVQVTNLSIFHFHSSSCWHQCQKHISFNLPLFPLLHWWKHIVKQNAAPNNQLFLANCFSPLTSMSKTTTLSLSNWVFFLCCSCCCWWCSNSPPAKYLLICYIIWLMPTLFLWQLPLYSCFHC